jgi:hypothetical protein
MVAHRRTARFSHLPSSRDIRTNHTNGETVERLSRFALQMNYAERANLPLSRACSAQAWDVNSSESCAWKVRFISSNDLADSGPEKLKSQAHSEQPHPSKVCPSTHTSLRDVLCLPLRGIQPSQADTPIVLPSQGQNIRCQALETRFAPGQKRICSFFKLLGGLVIPSLLQPRHCIHHEPFFDV